MKQTFAMLLLIATLNATAQDSSTRSAFRNGYMRIGLNYLGNELVNSLSPKSNVFNGNFGATTGYCFEFGRNFYFNKKTTSRLKYGLDWTYLSLTYNKPNWNSYAKSSGAGDTYIDGKAIAASVSGRLGPVVSFNPVEKLVIDARFQVAPSAYFFDHSYYKNQGLPNEQYFEFVDYEREDTEDGYDAESIKNRLSFGVKTAFGVTIRRKAIGLSLDYIPGKVKVNYGSNEGNGQEKIKANNLQLKLSFQL
jgi:hypothetical protein